MIIPLLSQVDSWLYRAVQSALNQSVPTQVIVVTAERTQQSNLMILQNLCRDHRNLTIAPQQGVGFANALNEGIRIAKTPRVGFLLSDDWLLPTAVESCLHHSSTIVSTSLLAFAEDGVTSIVGADCFINRSRYDRLPTLERKADYLSHFFLFYREAILSIGGVDETIGDAPGIDDYDMIWTLLENGATVSIVECPLYCYRDHGRQRLTLRPPLEQIKTLLKIFDKHKIYEPERSTLLAAHAAWFGRPIHEVLGSVPESGC